MVTLYGQEVMSLSPVPFRVIKSRRMRCTRHLARMGEIKLHKVLIGKPEGKRPLGRPNCFCDPPSLIPTGYQGEAHSYNAEV
jgi:hypothetical protein